MQEIIRTARAMVLIMTPLLCFDCSLSCSLLGYFGFVLLCRVVVLAESNFSRSEGGRRPLIN